METLAAKACTKCGEVKPLEQFSPHATGKLGRRPWCKPCNAAQARRWARVNRERATERRRVSQLPRQYGITAEDFDRMLAQQSGVCAICGSDEPNAHGRTGRKFRLSVDHCHSTGRVRGLLCQRCNRAIGLLGDDVGLLQAAIDYLKKGSDSHR